MSLFGTWIEPSNVKAGGKACPIRFQCAGCGFYGPGPSYFPAIEEHINSLAADREIASAMDAASFVTDNLNAQIDAFRNVLDTMRRALDQLDAELRDQVEQASADHVQPASELMHDEIFGPVAPIVGFTDDDDAIDQANRTDYGLISHVFTEDLRRGLQVAERLETGMVGLNRGMVSDPSAPFGGTKTSGLGREGGHERMLEYTETKYIATDW